MENEISLNTNSICIENRKNVEIEGVRKLEGFDQNEFLIETNMGMLHIKGKDLVLGSLNQEKGTLSLSGQINSINYLDAAKKTKNEGFFARLFK